MATAKSGAFDRADIKLAATFKAMSHPARLDILRILAQRGTCICGEIVEEIPLAQATVSQHLRVLKDAGLIVGEIDGPAVCYCVDPEALNRLRAVTEAYFESITTSCC
jgi:ArsR family transcriptional regulator